LIFELIKLSTFQNYYNKFNKYINNFSVKVFIIYIYYLTCSIFYDLLTLVGLTSQNLIELSFPAVLSPVSRGSIYTLGQEGLQGSAKASVKGGVGTKANGKPSVKLISKAEL